MTLCLYNRMRIAAFRRTAVKTGTVTAIKSKFALFWCLLILKLAYQHCKTTQRQVSSEELLQLNFRLFRDLRNPPEGEGSAHWKRGTDTIGTSNMFDTGKVKEKNKRIDYVLVHPLKTPDEETDPDDREELRRKIDMRDKFENALQKKKIQIQEDTYGENMYLKLHVPFEVLCLEAERVKLDMPLHGVRFSFVIFTLF